MFSRIRPISRLANERSLHVRPKGGQNKKGGKYLVSNRGHLLQQTRHFGVESEAKEGNGLTCSNTIPEDTGVPVGIEGDAAESDGMTVCNTIPKDTDVKSSETFASLLRHSTFMQMGNPVGKVRLSIGQPFAFRYYSGGRQFFARLMQQCFSYFRWWLEKSIIQLMTISTSTLDSNFHAFVKNREVQLVPSSIGVQRFGLWCID